MPRRGLSLALVVVVLAQVLAMAAFVPACVDACTAEGEAEECPPVCSLCTSCPHAQQAELAAPAASPLTEVRALDECRPGAAPRQLASDIFHVPLPG